MSSSIKQHPHFLDCEIDTLLKSNTHQCQSFHQQSLHQTTTTTYEWIKHKLRNEKRRYIELKGKLTKIAGKDKWGFDNSSMQNAMSNSPCYLKFNQRNNKLYISDQGNHIIRSITNISISNDNNDKWNGELKVEVGQPKQEGYSNGDRNTCKLRWPSGFDWDMNDNIYICNESCICKLDGKSNQVTLVAGDKSRTGYKDGNHDEARFCGLVGMLCYQHNYFQYLLYVCDYMSYCIRMIDVTNGKTTTFAGKGKEVGDVDGTLQSARFNLPSGIVKDDENNHIFYVSDSGNNKIKMIDMEKGMVSTLVGDENDTSILNSPQQMQMIDSFIYVACHGFRDCIVRIDKHSKQVKKIKFNDGNEVSDSLLGITYHELDQCFYISDRPNIYKLE